ncbi:MAG: MOSC domain-containing protein [Gammaproteobacteria bacterium]|jgi:MOSC domain-containing protein YiiM|nr:MOSC domain-containing protein [Gammaproteobacteria bacterium]
MTLEDLLSTLPQQGTVEWLGLRPQRLAPLATQANVLATPDAGLTGDHYSGKSGKRQVTLIQAEHISAVASMLGRESLDPATLRRNLVVRGINLLALKGKAFDIGDATLEFTGLCHPCARMEALLGPGGYNAMRGHGGITARVIAGGQIAVGSTVRARV